jgi:Family of unknown function (DUF6496)
MKAEESAMAKDKVDTVMHEFKTGSLKSGSGKRVTNRKQAVAIALNEQRGAGKRTPRNKGKSR